jgi:hypothetical protein
VAALLAVVVGLLAPGGAGHDVLVWPLPGGQCIRGDTLSSVTCALMT